jgi:hypothetical protein
MNETLQVSPLLPFIWRSLPGCDFDYAEALLVGLINQQRDP